MKNFSLFCYPYFRVVLFCIFFFSIHSFAQEKPLYFDKGWKESGKSDAVYFRPLPLAKLGNLELLRDYYMKDKKLQMQGYIADGDHKSYVGDVFWFSPEGENSSGYSFINKTREKKLTYYFDDGKIWKTVEYGDSLKAGKTIEYKPDGTILGEAVYKDGFLESGTVGFTDFNEYRRYNKKGNYDEGVFFPKKIEQRMLKYKKVYYWKKSLKTAVEYVYQNNDVIQESNFDENGNLIQQLDSTSYFYPEKEFKNGKKIYYRPHKSAIVEPPPYIDYRSYPFSEVSMETVSYIILYRGTVHFLEKHPIEAKYREIQYRFFKDKNEKLMRLERNYRFAEVWKPLEKYLDSETILIPISDIDALSKEQIFQKFSKKKWTNAYLKNKTISEQLYLSSPDFMGKKTQYLSSGKTLTDEQESAMIYISPAPGKYIILREKGGYLIPKSSGDVIEIPNYVQE